MDTFFLFISQNLVAVTLLLTCLVALIFYEGRKGGKKLDPNEATRKINREGALVLELVKTPVTILPASRKISVKSSRSLYFIFAHKEENLAPLIINFLLLEKSIFFIYFKLTLLITVKKNQ